MRLAVDASVLVTELMRRRSYPLLRDDRLTLVVAADAWAETDYEIQRRARTLRERGILNADEAQRLLADAYTLAADDIDIQPDTRDTEVEAEARWRIPGDPRDVPTVAVALALGCGIWTTDRHSSAVVCPCGRLRCCGGGWLRRPPVATAVAVRGRWRPSRRLSSHSGWGR